jgi:hypothetical protein
MTMTSPPGAEARLRAVPTCRGSRFCWDRFLLGCCAAFHVLAAVLLLFAPEDLLLTEATRPPLEVLSRYCWAGLYLLAGALSVAVTRWRWPALQMLSAVTVAAVGGGWYAAILLAVAHGRGAAFALIIWPFLYTPWGIVSVRLGLRRFR